MQRGTQGGSIHRASRAVSPALSAALDSQSMTAPGFGAKGDVSKMPRLRILLLGLLAMLAMSAVSSATASATELQGPWWRHPESSKQVKWPENEEHAITASNTGLGNFRLVSKGNAVLGNVTIECKKVTSTGNIWNGLHQGEDNANALFEECESIGTVSGKCPNVKVGEVKAYSELMWKYRGEAKELKEPGQQKIYDVFAPTTEPKGGKAPYTVITFPEGCVGHGTLFEVTATGSEATFIDQHQEPHPIVWGTAALVEPQNADVTKGFLHWIIPNVTKLHHQEKEVVAKLEFGGKPAELEGTLAVELTAGGMFGAYNE
jgi:hypothetical protein